MKISISKAKQIREDVGATHIVIFAVDAAGEQHVVTQGETEQDAAEAAAAGNKLKAALGWPAEMCKSKPLQRICKNCAFFKRDYGVFCFNGWSGDGSRGHCQFEPQRVAVSATDKCHHFEPSA